MGLVLPLFLWLWFKECQLLSSLPYVFSPIAHSAELCVWPSTMDQSRRERASWVEGKRAEQSYYISTVVRLCWVSLNKVVILWNSRGASLSPSPTSLLTPLSSSPYLGKYIISCRSLATSPTCGNSFCSHHWTLNCLTTSNPLLPLLPSRLNLNHHTW